MDKLTIIIFGNQIFLEIINELKLFSEFNIKFYSDINLCIKDALQQKQLAIFFIRDTNKQDFEKIKINNFPLIVISKSLPIKKILSSEFIEQINMPFSILDLKKKVISLLARYEFYKGSLIDLNGYIINKNERKIKRSNLELQLTEKEINFLILFSQSNKPLNRNFLLKNVWNYSSKSDTHTIETHIHRLRKKILEKFGDNDFIKNNKRGYYI